MMTFPAVSNVKPGNAQKKTHVGIVLLFEKASSVTPVNTVTKANIYYPVAATIVQNASSTLSDQ